MILSPKADQQYRRAITSERQGAFATENSMISMDVCAKDGIGVARAFRQIVANLTHIPMSDTETDQIKTKTVVATIPSQRHNPAGVEVSLG